MVGADAARIDALRAHALEIARVTGKPVKLLRSTSLEVVEVLQP
jgi:hypothetical protein